MAEANNPKRQRQKELRKARKEEQQRLEKARRRRLMILLAILGALVVVLVMVRFTNSSDDADVVAEQSPSPAPDLAIDTSKTYTAVMKTSLGDVTIELADDTSPNTVNSFVSLSQEGFYDGLIFHRIVSDFALQGGSPNGDGIGGPGYQVQDDVPDDVEYLRGIVAMAKTVSDPAGTSGSQFFIVPDDSADERLTPDYAILGTVVDGFDVVDALNDVQVQPSASGEVSSPVDPPVIETIEISES